jgi:pimeloyl-ACP methyl ester carboxylesterase
MLSKKKKLFWQFRKLNKPTLVVYGSEDEYTSAPAEQAVARLQEEVTHPELVTFATIKGADHGFTGKEKEFIATTTDWLKQD